MQFGQEFRLGSIDVRYIERVPLLQLGVGTFGPVLDGAHVHSARARGKPPIVVFDFGFELGHRLYYERLLSTDCRSSFRMHKVGSVDKYY